MNIQDKNKILDIEIETMFLKLEMYINNKKLNESIQVPSNIIINILKMRHRDSQMKSPTALLMKQAILDAYPIDVRFHHEPTFSERYFFFYDPPQCYITSYKITSMDIKRLP